MLTDASDNALLGDHDRPGRRPRSTLAQTSSKDLYKRERRRHSAAQARVRASPRR